MKPLRASQLVKGGCCMKPIICILFSKIVVEKKNTIPNAKKKRVTMVFLKACFLGVISLLS